MKQDLKNDSIEIEVEMKNEQSSSHWLRLSKLEELRLGIPSKPGCYKYLDKHNRIIYVGKAKNLRKRVNSYFTKTTIDFKTALLLDKMHSIEYVVTNTEQEALILENNLIKQYQPLYNILLKDGKSYPYICIKNEPFPRVFFTRKRIEDGSVYFGPYPNYAGMRVILDFIRDAFTVRTCALPLNDVNIRAGKFRPCLEYHIQKCKAPCIGSQKEQEYDSDIDQIKHILRGHVSAVYKNLEQEMDLAVKELNFERAAEIKSRLAQVNHYKSKSVVMSEKLVDLEVLTISHNDLLAVVNHFQVRSGGITATHAYVIERKHQETPQELLLAVVNTLLSNSESFARLLLSNILLESIEIPDDIHIEIPQKGDKYHLVELSLKNCNELLFEKSSVSRIGYWDERQNKLMENMKMDLRLTKPPYHIECFDNSNIQGYEPVSACVVFRNGKPSKKDYRHFRVKTVQGPDDFATMHEVVLRRYRGLLERDEPLPDLILIDGGKGQLSYAVQALQELKLENKIPIIGIAKRLEEIYYLNDSVPLYIDKKSSTLRVLQQIRNEAHRFAITYHRKRRDMATLRTQLTEVPGIGEKLATLLLKEFASLKGVHQASDEDLARVIGINKVAAVREWLPKLLSKNQL